MNQTHTMNTVQRNKVVYITYSILNAAHAVVEQHEVPVAYLHAGSGGLLPSIEAAVEGHSVGDRVELALAPEDAYGLRDESLVFTDDLENVPPQFRRIGAEIQFENEAGIAKAFYVTQIEDGKLTVDGNASLAGQSVTCIVNVIEIRDASAEEIRNGRPADEVAQTQLH
jgi:FKBP-type peptidyl-prolyl cis-trans isomerase SlyD